MIRVVIADDHRVVRDGLCYLLSQEPDVEVVGEAGDGQRALDVVAAARPDVLLLDLYMPEPDGHAVLTALHDAPHRPAVIVLTSATDDDNLVRAMRVGATSYLLKTAAAERVLAAVRDAAAGTASLSPELLTRLTAALRRPPPPDPLEPLSPREREVLRLIARGHSNRQIARTWRSASRPSRPTSAASSPSSACKTASRRRSSPSATKPTTASAASGPPSPRERAASHRRAVAGGRSRSAP